MHARVFRSASRAVVPPLLVTMLAFAAPPTLGAGDDADWDVARSLGFERRLAFETSRGTWMNLDVHPDGRTIVFDLLGDLYTLPIGGGTATRLRGGPAFEHQPRFSPDGARIVFVGDAGGSDQLWWMPATGGEAKPLTEEKEAFPTTPAWTPDGEFLVYKKHVRDTRSLGGGELWMVHRDGGSGAKLVDKQSFTSELVEPAVSPDGEWVYFSFAGPFDYNRDVHAGIFQIDRVHLPTGRREAVTRSAGGAVRPTLSPRGDRLAFVRRIGTATVLVIRELDGGTERVLWDGLDPDQMETWAVHGAFPAFDWTPDGDALIVHAGGGFRRVDAESGAVSEIPFSASIDLPLAETLAPRIDVLDGARRRARILRWIVPLDGGGYVFQALGSLWRVGPAGGAPERIFADDARLQFAPALSPDGSWLAWTTWDDAEGSGLWRGRLDGGEPERLASGTDVWANPAWSPGGTQLALLAGSGRAARGAALSAETHHRLRVFDLPRRRFRDVTTTPNRGANRRMPRLAWDADGAHLLLFENADGKTRLVQVDLLGRYRRTLAVSETAEEIVLSPDGRTVAFKDLHRVYVSPIAPTAGEPLELERSGGAFPVRELTRWGGDWLAFDARSETLSWTLGDRIYRQPLENLFVPDTGPREEEAKPARARGRKKTKGAAAPEPPPPGNAAAGATEIEVALDFEVARPEGLVALTGGRVVTMNGDEVVESGTVLVEGETIRAIGPAATVEIPAGARTIDVSGKTVLPGLVDVHAHMGYQALDVNPTAPWPHFANLGYGVTTTHDPSASTQFVFSNAELVGSGRVTGPRVFSTGFILYGAKNPNRAPIASLEEARQHVKRMKAHGAFSVKSYNQMRRDARQWVLQAAREEGMRVYPEGGSMLQQNLSQMIDGHTGIEHALPVAPLYEDVVRLAAESGTGYTPTLVVGYGGIWGENYWYQVDDVYADARLRRFTPRGLLDARARRRIQVPEEEFWHFRLAADAKRILDAGGSVQLGSHGQLQGLAAHWELWMFEQGGMTPLEALRASTRLGARYLGLEHRIGSLEPGKLADLFVVDGNPLEDLRSSTSVAFVMKHGFLWDGEMNAVWPEPSPRPPLRGVD